jgi:cyclin D2
LDRFLSKKNLSKNCFQAVAAGCLLLSSKFSEVRPLTTEKLSLYTDSSVSTVELKEWEIKILNVLHWELTAVTTQDFLDHFMPNYSTKNQTIARIRKHAEILATVAVTEYKFLLVEPSLLAAACLAATCQGLAQDSLLLNLLPAPLLIQSGQISVLVDHLEDLLTAGSNTTSSHTSCSSSSTSSQRLPPFHTVAKTAPCYPDEQYYHQLADFLSLASSAVGG